MMPVSAERSRRDTGAPNHTGISSSCGEFRRRVSPPGGLPVASVARRVRRAGVASRLLRRGRWQLPRIESGRERRSRSSNGSSNGQGVTGGHPAEPEITPTPSKRQLLRAIER